MKVLVVFALAGLVGGCAPRPVPASRQQQVEQITQTGPYSYQRAVGGMPR